MKMNDMRNVNTPSGYTVFVCQNTIDKTPQQTPTKFAWPDHHNDIVVFFGVTQDEDERYCDTNIVDGLDIRCRD